MWGGSEQILFIAGEKLLDLLLFYLRTDCLSLPSQITRKYSNMGVVQLPVAENIANITPTPIYPTQ